MINIKSHHHSKKNFTIKSECIDYNSMHPIFSFEHLQKDFNFKKRTELQEKHFKTFLYKIETLSTLTWIDIIKLPRENGMEKITLSIDLPKFITDDIKLQSIRFGQIERIIGYKINNIFYILYIDVNGKTYKH